MAVTLGPHVLSRGELTPKKYKAKTSQTAQMAGDGSIAISGSDIVERFWNIRVKLPRVEGEKIVAWIENSLRFRAEKTPVIDFLGVTRTMNYWDDETNWSLGGGLFIELDLVFREEVIA